MRPRIVFLFSVLVLIASSCPAAETASVRSGHPNLIIILADDLGFSDIACYGGEIRTPALDRLAEEGVRFTQFYNMARCGPSRASLLTGLYPHQTGHAQWGVERAGLKRPPAYAGFRTDIPTLPAVLKDAGYNTYMSGKWHLGSAPESWPVQRGFDRYWGMIGGATGYFRPTELMVMDDQKWDVPQEFYMTDATTEHALQFLDLQKKRAAPFFLYVAYTAPHFPLQAREEDIAAYKGVYDEGWDVLRERRFARLQQLGIVGPETRLSPRAEELPAWDAAPQNARDVWKADMETYAAMVDVMDRGVAKIMEKLRDIGAHDDTLVVFLSDNGACAEGAQAKSGRSRTYGVHGANFSNTPLRMFKKWSHEGGISTPFIAWFPRRIPAGRIERAPAHIIDLFPTFAELAGLPGTASEPGKRLAPVEGISLVPLLTEGRATPERTLFWEHIGNRAVRRGDWKLVAENKGPWELYDLSHDRSELDDLAATRPETVRSLAELWTAWARRVGVHGE